MDRIREKLNNAALELKIAVFCAVIMVLSGVYKVIDPRLGDVINNLAIATFGMSVAVFVYKLIFGSFNITVMLVFLSLYIASIGVIIDEGILSYGGIVFSLLAVAVKAFTWIFFKKKTPTDPVEHDDEKK